VLDEGIADVLEMVGAGPNVTNHSSSFQVCALLELDAVRARPADLRAEIDEYEQLRAGRMSTFEAS